MASATCLSTTKAISVLDASPAPRSRWIRTTQDPAAGAERNSNAASTHFRSRRMRRLVTVREHSTFLWLWASTTDEKSSDSSVARPRGRLLVFSGARLLFLGRLLSLVSWLPRWQVRLLHSPVWTR